MMRNLLILILLANSLSAMSQASNNKLIELAKVYRSYHFSNTPTEEVLNKLSSYKSSDLKTCAEFISELIKPNNSVATKRYLTKPDSTTLKNLFIIRSVNWNLSEADPTTDHNSLIDSLKGGEIEYLELLACYYEMAFVSIGNKNRPLNMSNISLNLDEYGLANDAEKGVFFLVSMDTFGMYIWGYMNVVKPPNYKKALEVINNYPKYNSAPYYEYQYLNFPDFNLTIDKREPKKVLKNIISIST